MLDVGQKDEFERRVVQGASSIHVMQLALLQSPAFHIPWYRWSRFDLKGLQWTRLRCAAEALLLKVQAINEDSHLTNQTG